MKYLLFIVWIWKKPALWLTESLRRQAWSRSVLILIKQVVWPYRNFIHGSSVCWCHLRNLEFITGIFYKDVRCYVEQFSWAIVPPHSSLSPLSPSKDTKPTVGLPWSFYWSPCQMVMIFPFLTREDWLWIQSLGTNMVSGYFTILFRFTSFWFAKRITAKSHPFSGF